MSKNIAADLQKLLKRASESKTQLVKSAEEIGPATAAEGAVGKTMAPVAGAQAAGTMAEAKATQSAGAVDVGAKTNPVGGAIANSTDGAAAGATDGQSGAKAPGEMGADKKVEPAISGDASRVMDTPAPNGTTGSFKSARAEAIRAIAAELHKAAASLISPMDKFLAKAARANTDPQIKKAADGMDDQALADASAGAIDEQLQGGQIDDATAAQILQEALAEGAITEEELIAAANELQGGAGAEGAEAVAGAEGDLSAEVAPEAALAEEAAAEGEPVAEEQAELMAADPNAEEKIAMAHIDGQHADYTQKLARAYPSAMQRGYELFQTCRTELVKQAEAATAAQPKLAEASDIVANSDEEKKALAAAAGQLGLSSSQLGDLVAAKTPAMDKTAAYRAQLLTKIAALGN